ncbi:hypothetical protein SAMN05421852_103154 [Thermoflavimicrobium dichotomicum]|uniref:Uncharacterized protein n=1 Tax=Thermoflavimicrobium dichotomicum TaxID=46223 RepID=A0A1I3MQ21_9BACL|nr:hypothetical protein SAMN05421852_103154 [Thermoflavimicrobium dichotomicum]
MLNFEIVFITQLQKMNTKPFLQLTNRQFAGMNFLYVILNPNTSQTKFENFLLTEAKRLISGTDWSFEYQYVRTSNQRLVYRFRFRAPEEKSFCCGNQCPHCILKR